MVNKKYLYLFYLLNMLILILDQIFHPQQIYFQYRIIIIAFNICFIVFTYFRKMTFKNILILAILIKINQFFGAFLFQ